MAQIVKTNGSPTVYSLRRALGLKARRPNRFNACIAAQLRGKKYGSAPAGMGGRHNKEAHAAFKAAVAACRGKGYTPSKRDVTAAEERFLRETGRGG